MHGDRPVMFPCKGNISYVERIDSDRHLLCSLWVFIAPLSSCLEPRGDKVVVADADSIRFH